MIKEMAVEVKIIHRLYIAKLCTSRAKVKVGLHVTRKNILFWTD